MFTEELNKYLIPRSPRSIDQQLRNPRMTAIDFQYQICSTFMKHTGEKLHFKQAQLIEKSKQIISQLSLQKSYKMQHSTAMDSTSQEAQQNPEDRYDDEQQRNSSINRRNISVITAKRSELNISEAMVQVQQKCSITTFAILTAIISEYKKLQNKCKGIQARENLLIKKQQSNDKYHQENIILKIKLQGQNNKIKLLQNDIESLKQKNKAIVDCVNQKIQNLQLNQKYMEINNKVYRDVKGYLSDKEVYINARVQKIQCIQRQIMNKIENAVFKNSNGESCLKCCEILKKIKESIMNYKNYLQNQAEQVEKLYSKHKKTLFIVKQKS